jgi:hypothetical protein
MFECALKTSHSPTFLMCVDEVFTLTHVEEMRENEEFSKHVHAKQSIKY